MIDATYFVTGTDTAVGKTFVASAILIRAAQCDLYTLAIKPVSAGCEDHGDGLVNDDALRLQELATVALDYDDVNPVALEPAIAPHLAAAEAGIALSAAALVAHCNHFRNREADLLLIEGAGGWLVPLNERETMADVCTALDVATVLVVSMKLGCLNHALLTADAMRSRGVRMAGWVANCVESGMARFEENVDTLRNRLPAPCLGVIPFLGTTCTPADAVTFLDIDPLLSQH